MSAAHPDVKIAAQSVQNDPYKTKLQVAMGAGQPPDVWYSFGGGGVLKQYVDAGEVMDLTSILGAAPFQDRFAPASAFGNMTFDGKIYAVPTVISGAFFFYDKQLFEKLGVKPWNTWDEFLAALQTLKSGGVVPLALANKGKWAGAFYYNYLVGRIAGFDFLPRVLSGAASFNSPEVVQAGKLLQDLAKLDVFSPGYDGLNYDTGDSRQLLYSGKAGMEMILNFFQGTALAESPDYAARMGFSPFPTIPGGKDDGSGIIGGVSAAFAISKGSKNPAGAVELINFLTDNTARDAFADGKTITALKGASPTDPLTKDLSNAFGKAKYFQLYWDQYLPPALGQAQLDVSQALLDMKTTPEAAAEQLAAVAKTAQ